MTMGHVADGEKIKLRSFCRVWVRESPAYVHFKHVASLIDDLSRSSHSSRMALPYLPLAMSIPSFRRTLNVEFATHWLRAYSTVFSRRV
jgi:hypothetical protein